MKSKKREPIRRIHSLETSQKTERQKISPSKSQPIKIKTFEIPELGSSTCKPKKKYTSKYSTNKVDMKDKITTDPVSGYHCQFCQKEFQNLRLLRRHEIVFCTKDWTKNFNNYP